MPCIRGRCWPASSCCYYYALSAATFSCRRRAAAGADRPASISSLVFLWLVLLASVFPLLRPPCWGWCGGAASSAVLSWPLPSGCCCLLRRVALLCLSAQPAAGRWQQLGAESVRRRCVCSRVVPAAGGLSYCSFFSAAPTARRQRDISLLASFLLPLLPLQPARCLGAGLWVAPAFVAYLWLLLAPPSGSPCLSSLFWRRFFFSSLVLLRTDSAAVIQSFLLSMIGPSVLLTAPLCGALPTIIPSFTAARPPR